MRGPQRNQQIKASSSQLALASGGGHWTKTFPTHSLKSFGHQDIQPKLQSNEVWQLLGDTDVTFQGCLGSKQSVGEKGQALRYCKQVCRQHTTKLQKGGILLAAHVSPGSGLGITRGRRQVSDRTNPEQVSCMPGDEQGWAKLG